MVKYLCTQYLSICVCVLACNIPGNIISNTGVWFGSWTNYFYFAFLNRPTLPVRYMRGNWCFCFLEHLFKLLFVWKMVHLQTMLHSQNVLEICVQRLGIWKLIWSMCCRNMMLNIIVRISLTAQNLGTFKFKHELWRG